MSELWCFREDDYGKGSVGSPLTHWLETPVSREGARSLGRTYCSIVIALI